MRGVLLSILGAIAITLLFLLLAIALNLGEATQCVDGFWGDCG